MSQEQEDIEELLGKLEGGEEVLRVLKMIESRNFDGSSKLQILNALRTISDQMPVSLFLNVLLSFLGPRENMDSVSATYGFCLAIGIATRHPEWAQAFAHRHYLVDHADTDQETNRESFDEFVKMMPLSITTEAPPEEE